MQERCKEKSERGKKKEDREELKVKEGGKKRGT
jgi:hypothetical protein